MLLLLLSIQRRDFESRKEIKDFLPFVLDFVFFLYCKWYKHTTTRNRFNKKDQLVRDGQVNSSQPWLSLQSFKYLHPNERVTRTFNWHWFFSDWKCLKTKFTNTFIESVPRNKWWAWATQYGNHRKQRVPPLFKSQWKLKINIAANYLEKGETTTRRSLNIFGCPHVTPFYGLENKHEK